MNAKSYFRYTSNLTIGINLIIGLSCVFLLERLLPFVHEIIKDNTSSLQAVLEMQKALNNYSSGTWSDTEKEIFWQAHKKAKMSANLPSETQLLLDIGSLGEQYFSGSLSLKGNLDEEISELARLNISEITKKYQHIRFLGTSGAWAVGFLVLLSVTIQLIFRARIFSTIIDPLSDFLLAIRDYFGGNILRRFNHPAASEELKETGRLLNVILDENMERRS